jgi:hypothetical protein
MKTERKTVGVTIKQVGEDGTFEAVIATFDEIDSDDDIVRPGAFGGLPASVLPSHRQDHVPLGKTIVEERGKLAVAVGRFNLEIGAAVEWHSALKFDLDNPPPVQQWSWGFRPVKTSFEEVDGRQIRVLEEIDLREVSPVLRGASVGTGTLSAKSEKTHETETSVDPWDAPDNARRLTAGAKDSCAFAIVLDDQGHFLHHMVDEKGDVGAASVHACLAGIAVLKGARGASTLDAEQRQGVYDHLAGHLKNADFEPPELGDKPGIRLVDQVRLATYDAQAVLKRIEQATSNRSLGRDAKATVLEMAEQHGELMKNLRGLAENMLPEDAVARAAARFLASEVAHHLEE